jgi:hypothetical protein
MNKKVTCLSCLPDEPATAVFAPRAHAAVSALPLRPSSEAWERNPIAKPIADSLPLPPPLQIEIGVGGISAEKEYARRKSKHERQIVAKWGTGRIGRFAKFMSDEPQSTQAWAKGAEGERRLARRLTNDLGDAAVVLHDRQVPKTRGNIDHLVIAPSGIWIVDAKNYKGKVELRDCGGWFSTDLRLYVNNRDQTKLVDGLTWQIDAVRTALSPIGFGEAPLHPTLCFTNSEWGLFAKPIRMKDVLVTWAGKLVDAIREPGPLDAAAIDLLAREFSSKLPASR